MLKLPARATAPAPRLAPRPALGPIPFTCGQMDFLAQDSSQRRAAMRSRLRDLRESAEIEKGLRGGEYEERRQKQTIPIASNWSQQEHRDMATATIGNFKKSLRIARVAICPPYKS
jgi:hypothetical protein